MVTTRRRFSSVVLAHMYAISPARIRDCLASDLLDLASGRNRSYSFRIAASQYSSASSLAARRHESACARTPRYPATCVLML